MSVADILRRGLGLKWSWAWGAGKGHDKSRERCAVCDGGRSGHRDYLHAFVARKPGQ